MLTFRMLICIGEVMMQDNSDKPLMPLFIHKVVVIAGCFAVVKAKEGGADVVLVDDFNL